MPPKKHGTTWQASPHTLSKIEIQRKYLDAWFAMMGTAGGFFATKPILYVEGFAGSGQYEGGIAGSAITAARAALTALENNSSNWSAGNVFLEFIEKDPTRATQLRSNLDTLDSHPRLKINIRNGDFARELNNVQQQHSTSFMNGYPLFTFLDPFGVKPIPFSIVRKLLAGDRSELLLFLNANSVARNWAAKNTGLLNDLFGNEETYYYADHVELCRLAANIYCQQLRDTGVRYTIPFALHGWGGTLDYYLVFASRHPAGFDKMASAMRTISTDDQFRFCDATHKNLPLDFGPNDAADRLVKIVGGRKGVTLDQINEIFRLEVLFPTVSTVLKHLQEREQIQVNWIDPKSPGPKGTFSAKRVKSIDFA